MSAILLHCTNYGGCVSVLYAAELPNYTLDTDVLRTRPEVFHLEKVDVMEGPVPFYPELVMHRVFSITVGKMVFKWLMLYNHIIF